MAEPTTKASLASAALGCALLNKLVQKLTEEQVDEIVGYDEALRLDQAVWSLFESAQKERKDSLDRAQVILEAHKDNEPDMDAVNASLKAIEEGRTQPIQDIIDGLT